MEIEEMESSWKKLSHRVENQETLTNKILEKINNRSYQSKINKIGYPEMIGTIICYIGAAYLIINFSRVEELILQVFSVVSIALLFVLPIISLKSVRELGRLNLTLSHTDFIQIYAEQKIKFNRLQRINVFLSFLFMICFTPVLLSINGKKIISIPYFWELMLPVGVLFFVLFSIWVLRYYNKVLKEMAGLLNEVYSII